MDLTPENKVHIDSLNHYALLERIRFAPSGDEWMQGETGNYWMKRHCELQAQNPGVAVADSKVLGW